MESICLFIQKGESTKYVLRNCLKIRVSSIIKVDIDALKILKILETPSEFIYLLDI